MDPLTGVGLAANVIQFVGFPSDLISKTSEITASATGTTNKITTTLDTMYTRLQALSIQQEHPRWNDLGIPSERLLWLVDQIAERAAGVFLWVFLVARDLWCGLTEYNCFEDLKRRLESIPTDLGAFFRQILDSVESTYHSKILSPSMEDTGADVRPRVGRCSPRARRVF